jgi:hypothetical protein
MAWAGTGFEPALVLAQALAMATATKKRPIHDLMVGKRDWQSVRELGMRRPQATRVPAVARPASPRRSPARTRQM